MNDYLEPARSVITAFGGGNLKRGVAVVEEITGRHRTRIYRWMKPKEDGGTGGTIPVKGFRLLEEAGKERSIEVPTSALYPSPENAHQNKTP